MRRQQNCCSNARNRHATKTIMRLIGRMIVPTLVRSQWWRPPTVGPAWSVVAHPDTDHQPCTISHVANQQQQQQPQQQRHCAPTSMTLAIAQHQRTHLVCSEAQVASGTQRSTWSRCLWLPSGLARLLGGTPLPVIKPIPAASNALLNAGTGMWCAPI